VATTAAATATAAATGVKVAFFRDAAEFEGLADHLGDGLLHLVHVFLGVEEAASDRVAEEGFAELFKVVDLSAIEGQAGLLLLLQGLSLHHQSVVLIPGLFIGHEGFNLLAHGFEFRLIENGLAKFLCLLRDNAVFDLGLHNLVNCAARSPLAVTTSQRLIIQHKKRIKATHSSIRAYRNEQRSVDVPWFEADNN
jgi:hypothetical protein